MNHTRSTNHLASLILLTIALLMLGTGTVLAQDTLPDTPGNFDASLLLTIAGLGIAVGVIIQLIKTPLGLTDEGRQAWLPLIAVMLGIVISFVATIILVDPHTNAILLQSVVNGVFGGFSAIGMHQSAKAVGLTTGLAQP